MAEDLTITRRRRITDRIDAIRRDLLMVPSGRIRALVLTKLDEAELWLTKIEDPEIDQ